MTIEVVVEIYREMLRTAALVAAPILGVAMMVGLGVSLMIRLPVCLCGAQESHTVVRLDVDLHVVSRPVGHSDDLWPVGAPSGYHAQLADQP